MHSWLLRCPCFRFCQWTNLRRTDSKTSLHTAELTNDVKWDGVQRQQCYHGVTRVHKGQVPTHLASTGTKQHWTERWYLRACCIVYVCLSVHTNYLKTPISTLTDMDKDTEMYQTGSSRDASGSQPVPRFVLIPPPSKGAISLLQLWECSSPRPPCIYWSLAHSTRRVLSYWRRPTIAGANTAQHLFFSVWGEPHTQCEHTAKCPSQCAVMNARPERLSA